MDSNATLTALRAAAVLRAKAQILSDSLRNVFAARPGEGKDGNVSSFSDLHDYVDANYYGGAFEDGVNRAVALALKLDPKGEDTFGETINQFWAPVQETLDGWIAGGGIRTAHAYLQEEDAGVTPAQVHALAAGLPVIDANVEEMFQ